MIKISYDDIVRKICEEKNVSKDEIDAKVTEKIRQLSDLVSKEGAAHIIANQMGVKVFESVNNREIKIKDVIPGMPVVNVNVRVLNLFGIRDFDTGKRKGRVANLNVGDETGMVRMVIWDEQLIKTLEEGKFKEGDILKVKAAYARDNNGYKELHLGTKSEIIVNPEGISVGDVVRQNQVNYNRKKINELQENESAEIFGTIVQVFDPRFYEACPSCGKKLVEGKCPEHVNVVATQIPILNIFFDDGFGNIRIVFFRDVVEKVLGLGKEEVLTLKEDLSKFEEIKSGLLGKQLVVVGRVSKNQMFDRLEFMARDVREITPEEILKQLQ